MANLKISQLTPLSGTPSNNVIIPVIDTNGDNLSITVGQIKATAHPPITLSGTTITSFSPSIFTQSGGVVSSTPTYPTLSGTSILSFNSSSFTQTSGVLSLIPVSPTLSGAAITSFNPASFSQSGGVLSIAAGTGGSTLTYSGTSLSSAVLDSGSFSNSSGTISITSATPSTLPAVGTLSGSTEVFVIQGNTAYSCTLAQLFAYGIPPAATPTISISNISAQTTGSAFTVSGTLANYSNTPFLQYCDNSGSFNVVSGTVTSTAFSFSHPSFAVAGNYTISIRDQNDVLATSNSFAVTGASEVLTIANITAPAAGAAFTVSGTYANNTPSSLDYSTNSGSTWTAASATISGGNYSFSAAGLNAGTYSVEIRDHNNPSITATSNSFTVASTTTTAASFSTQPPTSAASGSPINYAVSLTPTGGSAYAALFLGGTQEGSRVAFTGSGSGPALTPASTGSYAVQIFASSGATSALATSNAIAVYVSAASFTTQPSTTGTTGSPINYAVGLTPSSGNAYAALFLAGTQEGSRVSFTGSGAGPALTPASNGSYTVEIFATSSSSTALATSNAIAVAAPAATAASFTTQPSTTDASGSPITYAVSLTPSYGSAYAALYKAGTQEGSRVSFTGSGVSLTPQSTGSYVVEIFATSSSSTPLVSSNAILVSLAPPALTAGTTPSFILDASAPTLYADTALTTAQTTNNGTVLGWKDSTSNHYDFSGSGSGMSLVTNATDAGQNGVYMPQNASGLSSVSSALAAAFYTAATTGNGVTLVLTYAFDVFPNGGGDGNFFAATGANGLIFRCCLRYGDTNVYWTTASGNTLLSNGGIPAAGTLVKQIITVNPSFAMELYTDNINSNNNNNYIAGGFAYDTSGTFTAIALYNNDSTQTDITLFEVDIYNSAATGNDITNIFSYLTTKWGNNLLVTAASFTTQPSTISASGSAINYAVALTPTSGTVYAALYKSGTQEGSRVSFTGSGAGPALTPASTGSYTVEIFASANATSALVTSNTITVAASASAASFTTQPPATSNAGSPINYSVSLTPSNGVAYAALFLSGSQEGSRVVFDVSGAGPTLMPASTGSYTVEIFATSSSSTALATSNAVTVALSTSTPPNVSGAAPFMILDASASTVYADSAFSTAQTTNSGTVLGWKDSTNNHYNFNQTSSASGASLVTNAQNGLPGLLFPNANTATMNGLASWAGAVGNACNVTGFTVAVTWKYGSYNGGYSNNVIGAGGGGDYFDIGAAYGNAQGYYFTSGHNQYNFTNLPAVGVLIKEIFVVGSNYLRVVCNGSDTGAAGGGGLHGNQTFTSGALGQTNGQSGADVTIFEVDMWPMAASSADITNIQNYLTNKWGVTITSTAASFTTQPPSSATSGNPISYSVSLTPSGATAYAALYKAGTQEGVMIAFTGSGAGPTLTPASTGSYTVEIFATYGASSALATSNAITVSASTSLPNAGGVAPSMVLDASASTLYADSAYSTAQTTNGGTVLGWKDSTNNHYNFNQTSAGTGGSLITNAQNGLPGILFPQSNLGNLTGPSAIAAAIQNAVVNGNGATIAVTYKYTSVSGSNDLIVFNTSSSSEYIQFGNINGNAQFYYNVTSGQQDAYTNLPPAGTLVKAILTFGPTSVNYYVNGATFSGGAVNKGTTTFTNITVGEAGNYQAGDATIFEVDVWEGPASSSDITNIQNYLTAKWGS